MRTLKPNNNDSKNALISPDMFAQWRAQIDALQLAINNINDKIDSLENEIEDPNIAKDHASFSSVEAGIISANSIDVNSVDANDISASNITLNEKMTGGSIEGASSISANEVSANSISASNGVITDITSDDIATNNVTAETATILSGVITNATLTNASIINASIANTVLPNIDATTLSAANATATSLSSTTANIGTLNATVANVGKAVIDELGNEYRTSEHLIHINTTTPNTEPYPRYIECPYIGDGTIRITLREPAQNKADEDVIFSLVATITEDAPLVTYSKTTDSSLTDIYFDKTTKKLILKTFNTGNLYWQTDDWNNTTPPIIYENEYTVGTPNYHFASARQAQAVIMGDGTTKVFTIQGILEADVKSSDDKLWEYYGDADVLINNILPAYLKNIGDRVEMAGYVYDKTDEKSYALEMFGKDSTGYYAVFDVENGQDKYYLNASDDVVFGLVGRTYEFDKLINA